MIVKCELCPVGCVLAENQRGKCRARVNLDGVLRCYHLWPSLQYSC